MALVVGTTVLSAYMAALHLQPAVWWNALGAVFFFAGIAFWHVAAAASMYAVKGSRKLVIHRRVLCFACGLAGYLVTLVIANTFLPRLNHTLYALDAGIIGFYAPVFCQHWALKNPSIAVACTIPILLGWNANGQPFTRETFLFCGILFCMIGAREATKDVEDMATDKAVTELYVDGGSRRTLATEFGATVAYRVASVWCTIGTLCLLGWLSTVQSTTPPALFALGLVPVCWFVRIGYQMFRSKTDAGVLSARIFHALATLAIWIVVQRIMTTVA